MKRYRIAILGASGAVGREMLKVLEERSLPIASLKLLASRRSAGKTLLFQGQPGGELFPHLPHNLSQKLFIVDLGTAFVPLQLLHMAVFQLDKYRKNGRRSRAC